MDGTELWHDFELSIQVDDVLRGQGADPEVVRRRRPALLLAARRALDEGRSRIRPAALVRELDVAGLRHERLILADGSSLTGPLVARHLGGSERIAAALCTISPALEIESTRRMGEDPLQAMALDGLGNAAVELLGQEVCGRIGAWAAAKGLLASTPLSPGSPGWPVEVGQPQIFALLAAAQAGIQISSGGMMYPQKSISFVVGIGHDVGQTQPCELCSLKEICRYRHD